MSAKEPRAEKKVNDADHAGARAYFQGEWPQDNPHIGYEDETEEFAAWNAGHLREELQDLRAACAELERDLRLKRGRIAALETP